MDVAAFGRNYRPFLDQVVPPFTTRVSGGDTWRCKWERLKTKVCTVSCSASGGITRGTLPHNVIVLKNLHVIARCEVLRAEVFNCQPFWYVTPCQLVSSFRLFKGPQYLYHRGHTVEEDYFTLKMETLRSRETLTARRYGGISQKHKSLYALLSPPTPMRI